MTSPVRGWRFLTGACVATAMLASSGGPAVAQGDDAALAHAKRLLKKTILFDGHNDLPWAIRGYKPAPGDLAAYDLRGKVPGANGSGALARRAPGRAVLVGVRAG